MKFLLDAQIPPSLKQLFIDNGFDCIHTCDLEQGNDTSDKIINTISVAEQRVLVTKDSDFYDSFIVKNESYILIIVKLGNIPKGFTLRTQSLKRKGREDRLCPLPYPLCVTLSFSHDPSP